MSIRRLLSSFHLFSIFITTMKSIPILLLALIPAVQGVRIVHSNDDGWAELTTRVLTESLISAGHVVVLSAPAENKSGTSTFFFFSFRSVFNFLALLDLSGCFHVTRRFNLLTSLDCTCFLISYRFIFIFLCSVVTFLTWCTSFVTRTVTLLRPLTSLDFSVSPRSICNMLSHFVRPTSC